MSFAEKLKKLRKQAGLSQEQLAEKLNVSRQAVTKWETNGGVPDVENIMAAAAFFHVSVDELLDNETAAGRGHGYLFESVTEYDIDRVKNYDIKIGWANALTVSGYEGEKLRVTLLSDTLDEIQKNFKVKIDDTPEWIDVDIRHSKAVTDAACQKELFIRIRLPQKYLRVVELNVNANKLELYSLTAKKIEADGKTENVILDGICGNLSLNCNADMNILCRSLHGKTEINQLFAVSKIVLPRDTKFNLIKKGIGTAVHYEENDKKTDDFHDKNASDVIEFNGIKSELTVCRRKNA